MSEALSTDIAASQAGVTLVLSAPAGFEFNSVRATDVAFTGAADITAASIGVAPGAVTVTFSTDAVADALDAITVGGVTSLQVRPTAGTPLASGNIVRAGGSTSSITGVDGTTNFGTLTEVAGTVSTLTLTAQPSGATAGLAFGAQPTVRVEDEFGNASTSGLAASLSVTASSASGSGPLQGTSALDIGTGAGNGTVSFTDLRIDVAQGGVTLDFAATGLSTATSAAFAVGAADASALRMVTEPAGATAGAAFGTQPVVQAIDAFGNDTASALPGTADAVLASGVGALLGTASVAFNGSGQATFTDLRLDTAQPAVTLDFTATGLTKATSAAFAVSPAAASALVLTTRPGGAVAGGTFGTQPALQTVDAQGNASTVGLPVSLLVTASVSTGTGPLLGVSSLDIGTTAGNGAVTFAGLRLDVAQHGAVLNFSAAGLLTAASAPLNVSGAGPSPLTSVVNLLHGQLPADGVSITTVLVSLRDAFGNRSNGTVTVSSSLGEAGPVEDLGGGSYRIVIVAAEETGFGSIAVSVDGVLYRTMTLVFTAAPGEFSIPLAESGATLVAYGGSTVDELLQLLAESGAASATATVDGRMFTLIPTELALVNEAFRAQFTPEVPAGTILFVRMLQ